MGRLFLHFLNDRQIAALKEAGHEVGDEAQSAGQHAVTIIKNSHVGLAIVDAIKALKDKDLSGVEKGERVLADAVPLILEFVTGGGASLVASVVDTAREVVQSLYNDTLGAVKHAAETAGSADHAAGLGAKTL